MGGLNEKFFIWQKDNKCPLCNKKFRKKDLSNTYYMGSEIRICKECDDKIERRFRC